MTDLKATLAALAEQQINAINSGVPTKEVAGSKLVRADEDITDV